MTETEKRIAAKEFAAAWSGRGDEKQEHSFVTATSHSSGPLPELIRYSIYTSFGALKL